MLASQRSRKFVLNFLQGTGVAAIAALLAFITFINRSISLNSAAYGNDSNPSFIMIGIFILWIITAIAYGFFLSYLYNQGRERLTNTLLTLTALIAPVLTLLGRWTNPVTFGDLWINAVMSVTWVYTVVMAIILIYNLRTILAGWVNSGETKEQLRKRKAREAAALARAKNIAPNNEPIRIDDEEAPTDGYASYNRLLQEPSHHTAP